MEKKLEFEELALINTPKKRLEVYKQALEITHDKGHKENGRGLCILLKELVGINFHSNEYPDTDKLFPEFGEHIDGYTPIKFSELWTLPIGSYVFLTATPEWRIKVLKNCIKLCQNKILK